jgi:hypothetical protein
MNEIRTLKPSEINVKFKTGGFRGAKQEPYGMFLLYKDARCDMSILDETYGAGNWKRDHQIIDGNLYCTISVWNEEIGQWVSKQDVGTESDSGDDKTDTKGNASDAFKRAGFNWGIGRELYTGPKIFIGLRVGEYREKGDKPYLNSWIHFRVWDIEYDEDRNIKKLVIVDNDGNVRFEWNGDRKAEEPAKPESVRNVISEVASAMKGTVVSRGSGDMLDEGEWNPKAGFDQLARMNNVEAVKQAFKNAGAKSMYNSTYDQYRMAYLSLEGENVA